MNGREFLDRLLERGEILPELPGGGSVRLWSGYDPDTLRGQYFDGVSVDDCSLQRERLW